MHEFTNRKVVIDNPNTEEGKKISDMELKKTRELVKEQVDKADCFVLLYVDGDGVSAYSSLDSRNYRNLVLGTTAWIKMVLESIRKIDEREKSR